MPEIHVFRAGTDADLERSIAVYNAVHPRDPADEAEIAKLKADGRLAENDQVYLDYWGRGGGHPSTPAGISR